MIDAITYIVAFLAGCLFGVLIMCILLIAKEVE